MASATINLRGPSVDPALPIIYPVDINNAVNAALLANYNATGGDGPFLPLIGGTVTGPTIFSTTITTPSSAPPILETVWNVTNTGGTGTTFDFQTSNVTNITSPAGQTIWANSDSINYTSPTPAISANFASYVARRSLVLATTNRGTAAGAPGLWAGIFDAVDTTPGPSSVSGQILTLEVDLEANGLDDANVRQGLVVVGATRNYPTSPTSEFTNGIGVFNQAGAVFKNQLTLWAAFNTAGINLQLATSVGGAPAIWMADGHKIAWNTLGTVTTRWDGSAVQFSSAVQVDGVLFTPNNLTVGGVATFAGNASFAGTVSGVGMTNLFASPPAIGSGVPSTGEFLSVFSIGNLTVGGVAEFAGGIDGAAAGVLTLFAAPPPIGGTTPASGRFTTVGFNSTAPIAKPTVTGSKGGNAALTSLLTALAAYGLVTDSTS